MSQQSLRLAVNGLMNPMTKPQLQLVSDHAVPGQAARLGAHELHGLADRLTVALRAGRGDRARAMLRQLRLSPIGIAAIATWMTRQGVSEADILKLVA